MRLAYLLLILALAPAAPAETQVVWEETPTHRVKVKYVDGAEVGRWRFRKKPSPPASPPPTPAAPTPDRVLPVVAPLADRELLELRLAELRARQLGEQLEDPAEAARTHQEVLALAHVSMQAAFARSGASPEAEAFTRIAAATFDPGDASVALSPTLHPMAGAVIERLRELKRLVPRDAGRAQRTRVFEGLLRTSGIYRATRQPGEALAAADEAAALLEGVDYPGVELARARAAKARALAMLAREERTHASGFVEKVYVRIPSQESCAQAVDALEEAQGALVAGLSAVQAMADSGDVPEAALPPLEAFRAEVQALRPLTRAATQCRSATIPPLGTSRRQERESPGQ